METSVQDRLIMNKPVVVVDYGMGNLWSVRSALCRLNVQPILTGDPAIVSAADTLILPGVGSFRKAMVALKTSGLADALSEAVLNKRRKILGICLGMQLLAQTGTEDGISNGLGFIETRVDRFSTNEVNLLKVPHIGFNQVIPTGQSQLFRELPSLLNFYFVHSYRIIPANLPGYKSICNYGVDFLAAYEYENIYATQFHPEKSQSNGLKLLYNFLKA